MAQTAVSAGDDIFFADQFGEADDALRYQFRMFDEQGNVVDHARKQNLALRQFRLLPNLPLVAMARIGRFEGDALDVGLEHDIDDVAEGDVA